MTTAEWNERKRDVGLGPDDAELLQKARPVWTEEAERVVAVLTADFQRAVDPRGLQADAETAADVNGVFRRHFDKLFSGDYGPDYLLDRQDGGRRQFRLGLPPRFSLEVYTQFLTLMAPVVQDKLPEALPPLIKISLLDQEITLSTYLSEDARVSAVDSLLVSQVMEQGSGAQSDGELARKVVAAVLDLTGWDYGIFWRWHKKREQLLCAAARGKPGLEPLLRASKASHQAEGQGLLGQAWARRELLLTGDLLARDGDGRAAAVSQAGIRSVLAIPVVAHPMAYGVLEFGASQVVPLPSERQQVLRTVGRVVALMFSTLRQEREARQRSEAVDKANQVLHALSRGDLTKTMEGRFSGELETLRDSIAMTLNRLRETVGDCLEAAFNVARSATEIAQGNADLSQRTEEQAASLEKTAVTVEQLTTTIRKNAESAQKSTDLALAAREEAEQGSVMMERMTAAMEAIKQHSDKINDILLVIDEIAFQTNLLALNAAVEAARAGEQGRGFAVVAAEVRSLAQRSTTAAKEIKGLIRSTTSSVESGTSLMVESSKALKTIVTAVTSVHQLISDISLASQEQASGVEQVNRSVVQLDQVTQQNAAMVEEAAAAAESLEAQARSLEEIMRFFTVDRAIGRPTEILPAVPEKPRKKRPVASEEELWEQF